jgi:hypothetical protein
VDGNRDFAQLAVVPTSHEKYVKALLQMPSFSVLINQPGIQAQF